MQKQTVRTTVTLPDQLLKAVDQAVEAGKAKSRNELIANALRRELAALRRLEIDSAFQEMSADQEYRDESLNLSEEFAEADSETLKQVEQSR
ncbi:MAG: ribbon-helix-helix protein, CopG family [Chloroflexi bacterium]|nr:ribbon-helix-helix protein, CopG family [Chloroflexota bacterium]